MGAELATVQASWQVLARRLIHFAIAALQLLRDHCTSSFLAAYCVVDTLIT